MRRAGTRKRAAERRKTPRSRKSQKKAPEAPSHSGVGQNVQAGNCSYCEKALNYDRGPALIVEEEKGRTFCSQECILAYFQPDIDRLENEYFKRLGADDLSEEVREELLSLRWKTLSHPDEIWREKTLAGDFRYTILSEFIHEGEPIWCVCITLLLRGEPSFLFLAFVSNDPALIDTYRNGERVEFENSQEPSIEFQEESLSDFEDEKEDLKSIDRLAEPWTDEETFMAELSGKRSENDIPHEEFSLYHECFDNTLEIPDEVWSVTAGAESPLNLYHFVRQFGGNQDDYWYIIVARETEDRDEIEILDAFPTRDPNLVQRYRCGRLEIAPGENSLESRTVH